MLERQDRRKDSDAGDSMFNAKYDTSTRFVNRTISCSSGDLRQLFSILRMANRVLRTDVRIRT